MIYHCKVRYHFAHLDIPGGDQVHAPLLAEAHPEGEAPALRPVEGVVLRRAGGNEAALRAHGVGRLAAEEARIHFHFSLLFLAGNSNFRICTT